MNKLLVFENFLPQCRAISSLIASLDFNSTISALTIVQKQETSKLGSSL